MNQDPFCWEIYYIMAGEQTSTPYLSSAATSSTVPTAVVAEPPMPDLLSHSLMISKPDSIEVEEAFQRLLAPAPEEQTQMSPIGEFSADIVVIGSGPGGYVSAIRAAQLGRCTGNRHRTHRVAVERYRASFAQGKRNRRRQQNTR